MSAASGNRLPKAASTASRYPAFPPNCNFCCTTAIRSGRPTTTTSRCCAHTSPPGRNDDSVTGNGSRVGRPQQLRATVGAVVGRTMARLRPESVLIVPVHDAEPAVGAWLGTTKVDFYGVPLHI